MKRQRSKSKLADKCNSSTGILNDSPKKSRSQDKRLKSPGSKDATKVKTTQSSRDKRSKKNSTATAAKNKTGQILEVNDLEPTNISSTVLKDVSEGPTTQKSSKKLGKRTTTQMLLESYSYSSLNQTIEKKSSAQKEKKQPSQGKKKENSPRRTQIQEGSKSRLEPKSPRGRKPKESKRGYSQINVTQKTVQKDVTEGHGESTITEHSVSSDEKKDKYGLEDNSSCQQSVQEVPPKKRQKTSNSKSSHRRTLKSQILQFSDQVLELNRNEQAKQQKSELDKKLQKQALLKSAFTKKKGQANNRGQSIPSTPTFGQISCNDAISVKSGLSNEQQIAENQSVSVNDQNSFQNSKGHQMGKPDETSSVSSLNAARWNHQDGQEAQKMTQQTTQQDSNGNLSNREFDQFSLLGQGKFSRHHEKLRHFKNVSDKEYLNLFADYNYSVKQNLKSLLKEVDFMQKMMEMRQGDDKNDQASKGKLNRNLVEEDNQSVISE